MAVIEQLDPRGAPPVAAPPEHAARADLRAQIDRLERALAELAAATYPWPDLSPVTAASGPPRLLGLGELERVRDALADRLATMRAAARRQAGAQAQARAELERMLADPPSHRGRRIANADLGLPGCTTYEVVPRLGLLGRLARWWHVKVSSGCPSGWGP
jgi:hypothetical protein